MPTVGALLLGDDSSSRCGPPAPITLNSWPANNGLPAGAGAATITRCSDETGGVAALMRPPWALREGIGDRHDSIKTVSTLSARQLFPVVAPQPADWLSAMEKRVRARGCTRDKAP